MKNYSNDSKVQHLISIMDDDMKRLAMGDTACSLLTFIEIVSIYINYNKRVRNYIITKRQKLNLTKLTETESQFVTNQWGGYFA